MKRFYIVPKVGDGLTPDTAARPKYVADSGVSWAAMDYGLEDTFLVGCEVSSEQHTQLASQLDVIAIPADLDSQIGLTALTTVQNKLEGLHVPADWVTTSHAYRFVVGVVGRLFLYMQRFNGREMRKFFEVGITLDTRVNQLTQAQRTAMLNAAIDLGLSTAPVTNSMTLRQALKILIDQLPQFTLFGEPF